MSNLKKGRIKDLYELTPMQEGILYHSLLNKESFAYVEMVVLDVEGELDYKYFQESFRKLIERYDVLRTVFVYEKVNRPVQVVLNQCETDICFEDIVQLSKENKESFIEEFKIKDKKRNFDLTKEIPVRFSAIKIDENSYKLVLTVHHIIVDGWSCGIILKEVLDIYESLKLNKPLSLGKVHQFSEYIKWLQKQDNEKTSLYWREYLNNYAKQAILPKNKFKLKYGEYKQQKLDFTISKDIKEDLEDIAHENNITLNTIIQAAWGILLQKYNNTNDVVFGAVVSGRTPDIPGIENMVGLFINTFPLRIQSFPNIKFTELVKEIYQSSIERNKHTYYPLAEIQAKTGLKQDLIDHIMVFENFPMESLNDLKDAELDFSIKNVETFEQTNYNFNIVINPWEGLRIEFIYNALIYDENTVQKIKEHFENILKTISHHPPIPIKDIEILNLEEKDNILYNFNKPHTEYSENKTITELFEEQAELTPNNVALVFEDEHFTYKELNEKSNELAHVLRDKGVVPDSIVGLMVDRSAWIIIGILGVLKAGGAYLPIDPSFPEERIQYMLHDSEAELLLTYHKHMDLEFKGEVLDLQDPDLYTGSSLNLEHLNTSHNLAYVIYTSGSTGKPKGVMIEHRAVNNFIEGMVDEIGFVSNEIILAITTISFDIFTLETLLPLTKGMCTVIANDEEQINIERLRDVIVKNRIGTVQLTPSRLKLIMNSNVDLSFLANIKKIIIGGESFPENTLEQLQKITKAKIFNVYGPTETTIWSTVKGLNRQEPMNIGKPIINTQIYILDGNLQPQPVGIPGELCISGDGLARGYLNNSQLTDEVFVDNPFTLGKRMYRTGDLARWLPDGNIEFLGRIDHQVKIRGYRIEPGEIENQLLKHPQIKETIITAQKDSGGDNYLCAYYVGDGKLTIKELREHLSKYLPDYMIPAYFVKLESMPLTPNGKIDRKALPEPDGSIQIGVEYVAPQNEFEEKLVLLWQNILGLEQIGIKDNFFELGGHSLKATTLVSQIHKEFNVSFPLRKVFQIPTLAEMAEYIKNTQENIYSSIKPAEKQEYYPMSSAQKRLYIMDQFEEDSLAYNMPGVMIIDGDLDIGRLEEAFQELIQRHETLRTSFTMTNGEPVQKIHPKIDFNSNYLKSEEEDINKLIKEFIKPFNLQEAPLIRVCLVKVNVNRHFLLFDMHHIISDGISLNILIKEFISLYRGITLPDLRIQYKDYAVWQNEQYQQKNLEKQEKYWLETFSDEIPVLDMPLDHPRPPVQNFEGDRLNFEINKELVEKINSVAQDSGATLYMMLLAAFNTLLSKYSGQEDIIVGSPIAGRPHPDLENIIGMFVNTLAMRNHPEGEKTFTQFLKEVKENALKAYENQDYQFEELIEKLDIKRDLSRNPLFDVMFALQNMDQTEMKMEGLKFTPYDNPFQISKFDLTLTATETKKGINLDWEYSTKIFGKETIQRLAKHYTHILEQVTETPDIKLKDFDLLTEKEKNRIIYDFNNTTTEYSYDKVHELFEEQAEHTPDNIAITYENQQLTYQELNEKSNQLARFLRNKGIKPNDIVGLLVERSPEMIIGLLGVLKAGGVHMPIDPYYPADRIKYIMEDSKADLLLINNDSLNSLDSFDYEFPVLNLESESIYKEDSDNLDNVNRPDDLAYIIYTSGTTGRPKGVMIEHQSITNTLQWSRKEFKLDDKENVLLLFSYVFDGFIQALFTPLISGSKVVLLNENDAKDPLAIKNTIKSNQITHFLIVPPLYSALLQYSNKEDLQTVKTVTLAGENTSKALIKESIEKNPHLELINDYGPSENAITSTINRNMTPQSNGIIGKPISNTQVYILDKNLQLQPVGIPGELCISGDGLARGYLNNSQLTDEVFVDNPFTPGKRMYRTGDLARWLPDGNIEFLGRIDYQVKIRGYRIEPGEIENQLLKHPQINEALVTAQRDSEGDNYLCAYYIANEEITTKKLRNHLSKELPDYMIPSYFIKLEKIPLTPNGKINRKALPQPDGSKQTGAEYVAPQNEVEEKLVSLWQNILGMEKIGINDNFFELGGHSLKATALISQIHKEFNIAFPLRKVFQTQTVAEMAEYIKNAQESIYSSIKPAEKQEYYPMSSAQKRLYILDKIENTNIAYNLPGVTLVEGPINRLRFEEVFQELIRRHETLRTSFEMVNGEPVQKIHEKVDFNINYLESTEEEAEEVVKGFIKPFNLNQAPLLRVNLIRIKENKHLLLFDMHHIISDGTSMNIMIQELISLHQGIKLPDLRIQYKDYSVWQKEQFQQENLEKQEKYWLETFNDEIPILDLPLDHPRPPVQNFEGNSLKFEMDQELVEKINSVAQDSGATLYMMLLAAFNTLLSRYTGQDDIIIGSPIAGRPHSDLENLIGMFVNTLAMRNHPQGEKTFRQFLKEVKENALKAYENQDYQFEELVEKLNIKRNLSRNPLFDVMFVLQNMDMNEVKIEGLKFTPHHNPFQISKFDLTLTATETINGINFEWEYRTQLLEKETIERLAKLYISILESIVANPDLKLEDIKIPKEVEKKTLLYDFDKTEVDDPEDEIITELFQKRVESAPDDIALVYGSRCLTYGELNNQVDQLTRVLRDKGVKNGSIVGLMVDHSLEMIIAILSIRKAGGSSLIADPDYPPDRIEYMLENSNCEILLSQEKYENIVLFRGEFINLENPHLFTNKEL